MIDKQYASLFALTGKVVVITGGAGLLGQQHAAAVAKYGAVPIILDISKEKAEAAAALINEEYGVESIGLSLDITLEEDVVSCLELIKRKYEKIDVLINNAANNPKVEKNTEEKDFSRLENFDLEVWNKDISVSLTGSFLCSKYFGHAISKNPDGGVIINVSSDLGVIAPDQRLYFKSEKSAEQQPVKPITYSVCKSGILGLTRYLATYWADRNVRCNAICPGGVLNNQDEDFLKKINTLIPLGRMANVDDYQGIIVFLCSDAAVYMTGAIINIDGGRTCW